ncbi:MAG: sigma-70 family RNA polymerase sigma factor [Verrucomicrobia bacterium]|nr:MAG: sigma-70 family RNA polymerase sigma factor [Verrucomicrobiota bacterium]
MAKFNTTRWSLIARASDLDPDGQKALEYLCQAYWPPLFAYVMRHGLEREDAQDVTQEFFSHLLEKGWLSRADIDRGKFRTFLLSAMQCHIDQYWRARMTQKRGGGKSFFSLNESLVAHEIQHALCATRPLSPEEAYDHRWALAVLGRALERLRMETATAGKAEWFLQMRPFLCEEARDGDYQVPAAALGLSTNAFAQAVQRLRGRYRQAVRAEIAGTVLDPEMIDEEMEILLEILRKNH